MNQDELKRQVARAALDHVPEGTIIGVGTGSTVNCFIDAWAQSGKAIAGAVSSSLQSTQRMRALGIPVFEPGEVETLPVYVDGADEIDPQGYMIKGGGAALTREKIVADLAQRFICIVDQSKVVDVLGRFPLPVEIVPMAAAQLIRRFATVGGKARVRPGVVTDNGMHILDVTGLRLSDPPTMEARISLWPGVVCVGIFAHHRASLCLVGTPSGVQTLRFDAPMALT